MGTAQVNNIGEYGGSKNTTLPSVVLPISNLGNMISLSCYAPATITAGNFLMLSHWASTGSSGQYQVTTGKTFRSYGLYMMNSAVPPFAVLAGYGTAALLVDNTLIAPTGAVYYSSGSTVGNITNDTQTLWIYLPVYMEFPSLSYPFIKCISGGGAINMIISGTEQ